MPIHIIRNDITKMNCDAIVNPTDSTFSGSGGIDAAIHKKAGVLLRKECQSLKSCQIGEAVLTKGYELQASYIIHTVGPKWKDGKHNEKEQLIQCYKSCMKIALDKKFESIAFPIISSGTFGFPKEDAFQIATQILQNYDLEIYIVVFDRQLTYISKQMYHDIEEYITDHYVEKSFNFYPHARNCFESDTIEFKLDESFSDALLGWIDKKGMKDSDCYKKANIDRKLFNKIKNNEEYHPKKETVLAFAIALELDLEETQTLLEKAGYVLSNSFKFDIIIQYFINNKIYDVMLINETLYSFDQKLLTN